jgi:hypothetical protein
MFRVATRLAFAAILGLMISGAQAAPWIDLTVNPQLPEYVQNPGGDMQATCTVDTDATTPNNLFLSILNASDEVVYDIAIPGEAVYELNWSVPQGLEDGFYRVRVEYWSQEGGLETIAESSFVIAGRTPGVCAFKFIDANGNGLYDEGEAYAEGWEMCLTGPNGPVDCRITDVDGAACWFFLPLGHYEMCETPQPPYEPTTPECQEFDLTGNEVIQIYFGNWIPPTEACCFPDGRCEILLAEDCVAQGGTPQGPGSNCDNPELCPPPPPVGACCLPDGSCQILTEEECRAQGGTQWTEGEDCIDDCPPVATSPSTWGRIKAQYR